MSMGKRRQSCALVAKLERSNLPKNKEEIKKRWYNIAATCRRELLQQLPVLHTKNGLSPRRVAATCRLVCTDLQVSKLKLLKKL